MDSPPPEAPEAGLRLSRIGLRDQIALAFAVVMLLFTITSLIHYYNQSAAAEAQQSQANSYELISRLEALQRSLLDQQAGVQGYLLTGRKEYLQRYQEGATAYADQLRVLLALSSKDPYRLTELREIEISGRLWRELLAEPLLASVGANKPDAASRTRLLGEDQLRVEDLRQRIGALAEAEQQRLTLPSRQLDAQARATRVISLAMLAGGALLGLAVVLSFTRWLTSPLLELTALMRRLSFGDHQFAVPHRERGDEIGEISRAIGVFRHSILDAERRSWIKTHVADTATRLQEAQTLAEFGAVLASKICEEFGIGWGLTWVREVDAAQLVFAGGYAVSDPETRSRTIAPGQGLVGQCLLDGRPRVLDSIPLGYLPVRTAPGQASPRSLAVFPLTGREAVLGVVELASLSPFDSKQREFIEELLLLAGLTLESLLKSLHTQRLLLASQTQSLRLQSSEEALRHEREKLTASNEALRDKSAAVEDAHRDLARKNQELERANRYKSEFLANVSHELRTPLNPLLLLSKSLADNRSGNLDSEQLESARIIHEGGGQLLRLINDILDLSKIEAGKMQAHAEPFRLGEFLTSLERAFKPSTVARQLDFQVHRAEGVPEDWNTDVGKLGQILNNLLGNACKFTAQGSISLTVEPAAASEPPGCIALRVRDTGIGISPDLQARLFQPFEQADSGTSRRFGGTGLGLAISRRLAGLMGGELRLHSAEGEGACFSLLLPRELPGAAPAPHAEPVTMPEFDLALTLPMNLPLPSSSGAQLNGRCVLIVDDDTRNLFALSRALTGQGLKVLMARDAAQGIRMLEQQPEIAAVLMDVMMPGMDGLEASRLIRARAAWKTLPLIAVTAKAMPGDRQACLDAGMSDYLAKPIEMPRLLEVLQASWPPARSL